MSTATIQTDNNNDLFLADGRNLVIITGAAACAQNVLHKTLMRVTEDIYNVLNGVDYFGTIFTAHRDVDAARKSLVDAIQTVPDVISVESITIDIRGDTFFYNAQILTVYGQLTVSNQS
jgi:hypothetical protein